ncbi:MAG: hypothetical protein SWX82_14435 [Cyanobacteriota bacterium]|nr:hypothetical protein [Cyanobacteriota bacterium]
MSSQNGQSPIHQEESQNSDSLNNSDSSSLQEESQNSDSLNNQEKLEEINLSREFFPTLKKYLTWDVGARIKSTNPLTVCLVILQLVSGYTTIRGATIVFSKSNKILSGFLGGTFQFLLILLLIFKAGNGGPKRRWFSIIVLTIVSIYCNFFFIYDETLGGELTKNSPKKIQAHNSLVRKIKSNFTDKLPRLEAQKSELERRRQNEINGTRGNPPGCGVECQRLTLEKENVQDEINQIKNIAEDNRINNVLALSAQEIKELPPKEIYDINLGAWSAIPENYKVPQPQFSDYENSEAFLIPFVKVYQEKEATAIASLIIAVIIDGLGLVLGSIPPSKNSLVLYRILAESLTSPIIGIKKVFATLRKSIKDNVEHFDTNISSLSSSTGIIKLVDLNGAKFLMNFYNAIDKHKELKIDAEKLYSEETYEKMKRENSSNEASIDSFEYLKTAYELLIDNMRYPPFEWIEEYPKENLLSEKLVGLMHNDENSNNKTKSEKGWKFKKKSYKQFVNWITEEIEEQLTNEQVTATGEITLRISRKIKDDQKKL